MVGWVFGLGLESQAFGPAFFLSCGSVGFLYHLMGAVQMDREGPGIDWMLRLVQWNFTKQV